MAWEEIAPSPVVWIDRRGGGATRTIRVDWTDLSQINLAFIEAFKLPLGGNFGGLASVAGFPWLIAAKASLSPMDPDNPDGNPNALLNTYSALGGKIVIDYQPWSQIFGMANGPGNDPTGPGGTGGSTAGQSNILASLSVKLGVETLIWPTRGLRTANAAPLNLYPTVTTAATGGTIQAGTFAVEITLIVNGVETGVSAENTIITAGGTSTITVSLPPAVPTGTTAFKVYVLSAAGGAGGLYFLQNGANGTAVGSSFTMTAPPLVAGPVPPNTAYNPGIHFSNTAFTVPGDVKAALMMPTQEFQITWKECAWPPWTAMAQCRGAVNADWFSGSPPETVLYLGADINRDYSIQAGANAWHLTHRFAGKNYGDLNHPKGWNFYMFPDGSFQRLCRATDGSPLFSLASFAGLFQLGP